MRTRSSRTCSANACKLYGVGGAILASRGQRSAIAASARLVRQAARGQRNRLSRRRRVGLVRCGEKPISGARAARAVLGLTVPVRLPANHQSRVPSQRTFRSSVSALRPTDPHEGREAVDPDWIGVALDVRSRLPRRGHGVMCVEAEVISKRGLKARDRMPGRLRQFG